MRRGLFAVSATLMLLGAGALLAPAALAATTGKIAYVSNVDGSDLDLYTVSSTGGVPTPLTATPADERDPSWSPNGRQLAFLSDADGDEEIWIMNADGSSPRQLTFDTVQQFAIDWSPDGRTLVFNTSGTPNVVSAINVDGTNQRPLSSHVGPGGPYGANFSPDGTKLVLMAYTGTLQPLGVMPSAGGPVTPITTAPPDAYAPDFTGDGKRIVYHSDGAPDGGPDDEILSIPAAGGPALQLTFNSSSENAARASRDGSGRIAYRSNADGDQEIYVMNGDGSGQLQLTFNSANDRSPDFQPTVKCGNGVATIVGTGVSETLLGGPGPDIISGQGGKDKIKGLGGKDTICGDAGNDNLNGGAGKDQLIGGKGKDKTIGGKGKDRCVGGKGADKAKGCEKVKSL
jgi:Tol biopolymer transport system component